MASWWLSHMHVSSALTMLRPSKLLPVRWILLSVSASAPGLCSSFPFMRGAIELPQAVRSFLSSGSWLKKRFAGIDFKGWFYFCNYTRDSHALPPVLSLLVSASALTWARWHCSPCVSLISIEWEGDGNGRLKTKGPKETRSSCQFKAWKQLDTVCLQGLTEGFSCWFLGRFWCEFVHSLTHVVYSKGAKDWNQ